MELSLLLVEVKGEGVLENIMEAVICNVQHSPSVIYIYRCRVVHDTNYVV